MLRRARRLLGDLVRMPGRLAASEQGVEAMRLALHESRTQLADALHQHIQDAAGPLDQQAQLVARLLEQQAQATAQLLAATLGLADSLNLMLRRQPARPYYALSGKWGLTQLSNGLPFFIDRRTRDLAPWILLGGTWENFVDDLLCALAGPGDWFVDVGANLGYYTVKVGNLIGPRGRGFAFEPNPEMFEMVQENVGINGFHERVTVFNAGAGAQAGRLDFGVDPSHPGGGTVYPPGQPPYGARIVTVPMVTVDDSLPADHPVDLIKIDVEGFEAMVFDGMARTLARSPEAAIVTEFSHAGWARFGDPVEMLLRYAGGRRLFRIFHDGRLEELGAEALAQAAQGDFVSYFLMLPRTPRRTAEIDGFLARFAAPAP